MKQTTIKSFKVIGVSVRTTNENGQSANDIQALWDEFMSEGVANKIPNKIDGEILSIYTNYESDHTKPYDTILGCRVSSLEEIPEGMIGQSFERGNYGEFISKGDLLQGIVYTTWTEIWEKDLDREFTADFEVYGEKVQNPIDAQVNIYIALKP